MQLNMDYLMQFACLKCVFIREIFFFRIAFSENGVLYHFKGGGGEN